MSLLSRSLIAARIASAFAATHRFSVRLMDRFPARPARFTSAARSFGQDWPLGHREAARSGLDQSEHGATLDEVGIRPAGSWFFPRSARSRNVASEGWHPYVPSAITHW